MQKSTTENGLDISMGKEKDEKIIQSGGNVFADLGVGEPEEYFAKAQIAKRLCDVINEKKLTQAKAARILGVDQPKVSLLMRGKLDGFSLDRLFRFLNALDNDVEIVIRPKKDDADKGHLHIKVG